MIEQLQVEVEVTRVEEHDVVATDDGTKVESRVHFCLEDIQDQVLLRRLPFGKAIAALVEESARGSEGTNVSNGDVVIRRRNTALKTLEYTIEEDSKEIAKFEGKLATDAKASVVNGVVSVRWKVDGNMSSAMIARLASAINSPSVSIKTSIPAGDQVDMFEQGVGS